MNAASSAIASSEAGVATDTRGEKDRVRLDDTSSTEKQHKRHFPRNKKSTYGIKWTPSEYPNKPPIYSSHYQTVCQA